MKEKQTNNKKENGPNRISAKMRVAFALGAMTLASFGVPKAIDAISESGDYGNRPLDVTPEEIGRIKKDPSVTKELGVGIYTVEPGDTLWSISKDIYGEEVDAREFVASATDQMKALAGGDNTVQIMPGQDIYYKTPEGDSGS